MPEGVSGDEKSEAVVKPDVRRSRVIEGRGDTDVDLV